MTIKIGLDQQSIVKVNATLKDVLGLIDSERQSKKAVSNAEIDTKTITEEARKNEMEIARGIREDPRNMLYISDNKNLKIVVDPNNPKGTSVTLRQQEFLMVDLKKYPGLTDARQAQNGSNEYLPVIIFGKSRDGQQTMHMGYAKYGEIKASSSRYYHSNGYPLIVNHGSKEDQDELNDFLFGINNRFIQDSRIKGFSFHRATNGSAVSLKSSPSGYVDVHKLKTDGGFEEYKRLETAEGLFAKEVTINGIPLVQVYVRSKVDPHVLTEGYITPKVLHKFTTRAGNGDR